MDRYTSFRILLLAVFALFLTGSAASAWDIQTIDEPYNKFEASHMMENVKVVELFDNDGDPVNISKLEDEENTDIYYKYNSSSEERVPMKHLHSGYYYANFSVNYTEGLDITYELFDSSSDGGVIDNETQSIEAGNMSVKLDNVDGKSNYFEGPVKAGEENLLFEVNVTDTVNNVSEENADVDVYFTNVSWTSDVYHLDNYEQGLYYNSKIDLPDGTSSRYVLHINASNTTDTGYEKPFGATSEVMETYPAIDGEIEYLNTTSGCNNQSFFTQCERGANIATGFNITESAAENVNLTLNLWNTDNSEWDNRSTEEMELENGTYRGNITVPDIDTSIYGKKFQLVYNATNDKREKVVRRNISYKTFKIGWRGSSKTALGNYDVELSFSKFFTPSPLTTSRLKGNVSVYDPTGENMADFNLSEMEYMESSGLHVREINLPADSETGIYSVDIEAENVYGDSKTLASSFNVTDVTQTFEINGGDDFEKDIGRTGNYTYNLSAENMISSEHNLTVKLHGDTQNFTEVNSGNEIQLTEDQEKNVSISFDISRVEDYEGEIKFLDQESKYNETMDIEINAPHCEYRSETVCAEGEVNVSTDDTGSSVRDLIVRNLGHMDENKTFSIDISGNISEHLTADPSSMEFDANEFENSTEERITLLNYSVRTPGYFEGVIDISNEEDSVAIPVSLNSDVESRDASIGVPSSIDLGSIPEGSETTEEITVENTGDVEVTVTDFSSDSFEVSADSISVSSGSEETISLTFSSVTSSSGELTLSAESSTEELSRDISVSANPVPDYSEQATELEQTYLTLDRQIPSNSSLQTDLNDAQSRISQIEAAYDQGNYDEAETIYKEVSSDMETIQQRVRSDTSSPGGDDQNQNPGTPDPEEGGVSFLPIVAGIFVIILIGFVAATSIEPEEGDPLYNLLGE